MMYHDFNVLYHDIFLQSNMILKFSSLSHHTPLLGLTFQKGKLHCSLSLLLSMKIPTKKHSDCLCFRPLQVNSLSFQNCQIFTDCVASSPARSHSPLPQIPKIPQSLSFVLPPPLPPGSLKSDRHNSSQYTIYCPQRTSKLLSPCQIERWSSILATLITQKTSSTISRPLDPYLLTSTAGRVLETRAPDPGDRIITPVAHSVRTRNTLSPK